ncbi:MAG: hypothetical protein CSA81_06790 [Acidobacteria bacterium]|nr:MAG: hypothetical protein CSA81_06790 [Acidobacteriota bacterium]
MGLYYLTKKEELHALDLCHSASKIGIDVETAGKNPLSPQQSFIRLLQIGTESDQFIVDIAELGMEDSVKALLVNPNITKILHSAKFDMKHLLFHYGFYIRPVFCTFLASRLLSSGNSRHRHSLRAVLKRYLGIEIDKSLQCSDWAAHLSEEQIAYAAKDVEYLVPLYQVMSKRLNELKLRKVSQLEFRTIEPVAQMELSGIRVDRKKLQCTIQETKREMRDIEHELEQMLKDDTLLPGFDSINLNSPDQVKRALEKRGHDLQSTSERELKSIQSKDPAIQKLLHYRHLHRILNSTLTSFNEHILPETGHVHPSYFQIASASGRFSCSDPNIQQVPREKRIRSLFIPDPGMLFVIADYSQVELRVAAGLAEDRIMLEAYAQGQDLHRLTASLTSGKPYDQISADERQAAKAINFGLIYAMGPKGLQASARQSYGVNMSIQEAEMFRTNFFKHYKGIRKWHQQLEETGKMQKYIRTAAGRIRSYHSESIRITELFNVPVQGTASEALKAALCLFHKKVTEQNLTACPVAIIHDEIIVQTKKEQAERSRQTLVESMVEGASWLVPNVPFEVDASIARSWADK